MVKQVVFDLESNGLLDEATTIWCGSFFELDTERMISFSPKNKNPDYINSMVKYIKGIDQLICHNIIFYDRPLIRKIMGYLIPLEKVIDTLILSKMMFPDTEGGYSLEAWGERFNIKKPMHEDWSQFSDEMLHRNIEDVKINVKLYKLIRSKRFEVD